MYVCMYVRTYIHTYVCMFAMIYTCIYVRGLYRAQGYIVYFIIRSLQYRNIANILENWYIVDRMAYGELYEMYLCQPHSIING